MSKNIELVKGLVNKFLEGDSEGYLEGCHENFFMGKYLVD